MGNAISNRLTRNALTLDEVRRRHLRIQLYLQETDAAERAVYDRLFRESSATVDVSSSSSDDDMVSFRTRFSNMSLEGVLTTMDWAAFRSRLLEKTRHVYNTLVIMDPDAYRAFCRIHARAKEMTRGRFDWIEQSK